MSLTKATLNNRYAVWALVIAAALFGARAYVSIPMQLFPDTAPPLVNVITAYPGANAQDVDETLSQNLEEEFAAIEGVIKIRTTSQDNLSVVTVEFRDSREVDLAAVDVQNAIARIRGELPKGILEPKVLKFSTSDRPIISVGLASKDLVRARKMAEDRFGPEMQRIKGVAAVDVFGGNRSAVLVELSQRDVKAYGIPLPKVVDTLRRYNSARPAGQIRTEKKQTMFRLESRAQSIDELQRIPITMPNGTRILLGEIATIRHGSLDDDARFAVNGKPSIAMQVFKTDEANTVKVVRRVEKKVEELNKRYVGYDFSIGEESASFTEVSVNNLLSNVWQALLFASVVIFLFLGRLKSSFVTIVSMPLSYGLTFAFMRAFEVEFNMVTLSAIILAVGMVVDATVVLLENITRKRDEEGLSAVQAAIEGTDEVRLAVLAGVGTTLVVLIPLLFLGGFIGKTFGPLALTLIFSFLSSVLVALVLVPVLTLYTARKSRLDGWSEKLIWPFTWLMDRLRGGYLITLKLALKQRLLTVFVLLLLFAGSMIGLARQGMEILPKMDSGSFFVTLETPSGSSLEETEGIVRQVEKILQEEAEVVKIQSQVGFEQGMRSMSSFGVQGPTQGFITATLSNRTERSETIWAIEDRVRKRVAKLPGIRTSTVRELGNTAKATTSAPIVVRISGEDPLVLDRLGEEVKRRIAAVPNVIEPTRNWRFDQKQVLVKVDKLRAGQLGISPEDLAMTMTMGSYGLLAGDFYGVEGTPDPIHVKYSAADDAESASLLDYPMFVPGSQVPVPLRAVAHLEETRGQGVVTREDLAPTLEISAFTMGRPLNFIIADVDKSLEGLVVPRGYDAKLTGEKSDLAEAKRELFTAFALALASVYLLLVAQLRSFLQPLTIMVSIPLSLIGVFAALWLAGKPASMPVMVGMILLAGIVVNNAIILIEFVRQKREQGVSRREALISSVSNRFRPIMMTSLSTIVGMIPLASEWALGAERFSPLALAVIGGMSAATVLTMIFIPVLYDLFDSISEGLGRLFRRPPAGASTAVLLVVFLFSGSAFAGELPNKDETKTLDLDQCVQMAIDKSHRLKQRQDEMLAAEYRHKQAFGRLLPKFSLSARYSRVSHVEPGTINLPMPEGMEVDPVQLGEAVDNQYSLRFSVEQPLFTGFALSSVFQSTTHAQELSRERERTEAAALKVQVQETYFNLLKAEQIKEITQHSLKNLRDHLGLVKTLHGAGRVTHLDVSRVESRISAARVNLVQTTGAVDGARLALSTLIGVPSTEGLKIKNVLESEDTPNPPSADSMVTQAYSNRPEIGVARSAAAIAEERVDIAGAGLLPQVGLRFGYNYDRPNQRYFPPKDQFDGSWDLSVMVNWTFWDWGATYHGMKAAEAEAKAANRAVAEAKEGVRMDVEGRLRSYRTEKEKITAARSGIKSAERAFGNAKVLFDAGRLTSLDLINAEFELTQARYQLVQALADARIDWAQVLRAAGS
ncbi:MAG: efflux RND transporter permease subunit [Deltaproteobacteria bacterium]|nr:efflux RND transporter permease subunit [Deltaproteobacteria bacterium]